MSSLDIISSLNVRIGNIMKIARMQRNVTNITTMWNVATQLADPADFRHTAHRPIIEHNHPMGPPKINIMENPMAAHDNEHPQHDVDRSSLPVKKDYLQNLNLKVGQNTCL